MEDTRRVLMLAFQFPPYGQSTGAQRTLAFMRHLPELGWMPILITARESAYPQTDAATLQDVPPNATVIRAFAMDVARTVAVRGAYPRILAWPDRWNSWIIGSVLAGLKAIRTYRPIALWATFPTPSALSAALLLNRISGLPLVGDLRDPMVYESWPDNAWDRKVYRRLERKLVGAARAIVVTTPGACRLYRERYPECATKFHIIPNGMDADLSLPAPQRSQDHATVTLLHSGLMEMPDRDPSAFLAAVRLLAERDPKSAASLRVVLRGSGRESQYQAMIVAQGIGDLVHLRPRIPRATAIEEMMAADGLLLFQGKHCNHQIPAKAYEYLFAGKPLLALTHAAGDTHALVHDEWGVPYCADMDDVESIANMLSSFIGDSRQDCAYIPPPALRERHTRRAQSVKLAAVLNEITARTHA